MSIDELDFSTLNKTSEKNILILWNNIFSKSIYGLDSKFIIKAILSKFKNEFASKLKNADLIIENKYRFDDFRNMEKCDVIFEMKNFDFHTIPFGDPEWMYVMSRCTHHIDLVYAYLYTNDKKYLDRFLYEFQKFIDLEKCVEKNYNQTWRTIDSSIRIINWIKCFELLKGIEISLEIKKYFIITLDDHYNYLIKNYNDLLMISNWGMMQFNALLVLSKILPTHQISILNKDYIIDQFSLQIDIQFNDDGSHWEQSPMYNFELLWNIFNGFTVMDNFDIKINNDIHCKVKKGLNFIISMSNFNNELILKGDTDRKNIESILMAFEYKYNYGLNFQIKNIESYFNLLVENGILYKRHDNKIIKNSIIYNRISGDWILKEYKNKNLIYFNAGLPTGGHSHGDLLSFNVILNNNNIIDDAGRYTYVLSKGRMLYKDELAHNTIGFMGKKYLNQIRAWSHEYDFKVYSNNFENDDISFVECFSPLFRKDDFKADVYRSIINSKNFSIILSESNNLNKSNYISEFRFNIINEKYISVINKKNSMTINPFSILFISKNFNCIWNKIKISNTYNENFNAKQLVLSSENKYNLLPIFINKSSELIEVKKINAHYFNGEIANDVIVYLLTTDKSKELFFYKTSYNNKNHTQVFCNGYVLKGVMGLIKNDKLIQIK